MNLSPTCNIFVWNVWSALNSEKLTNLLLLLEDKNIQVACITETWFDLITEKFTALIKERGFEIVHSVRENSNNLQKEFV